MKAVNGADDALFADEDLPVRDEIAGRCRVREMTGHTRAPTGGSAEPAFRSWLLAFDERANRTLHEQYDPAGTRRRQWLYDGEGRCVAQLGHDRHGALEDRTEVVYERGRWVEKRMYSPPGRMHYRIVAERAEGGRLARAAYRDAVGEPLRCDTYDYDARGRLVRVASDIGERVFVYRDDGNLARKVVTMPAASRYGERYAFEYDERGLLSAMTREHADVTAFTYAFFSPPSRAGVRQG